MKRHCACGKSWEGDGACPACARLIDYSDQPGLALDLLLQAGLTEKEVAGVDEADREPLLRELRRAKGAASGDDK